MTRPSPVEPDVADEIDFHLAEVVDTLVAQGMTPDDARREALRRFGDRARYGRDLQHIQRQVRKGAFMRFDQFGFDFRCALRSLRAAPSFTATMVLVLTLGTAATTAIFSLLDVVVLRALPYRESARLMAVGERRPGMRAGNDPDGLIRMGQANYLDVARDQRVFAAIGAMSPGAVTLELDGSDPEDLVGTRATAAVFDVLGVAPARGRGFTAEDASTAGRRVAVISDALWRSHLGADPGAVGRTIRLDGELVEIVGVMPPGFTYPAGAPRPVDVWTPLVLPAQTPATVDVVARLAPGVSETEAQAQMAQLTTVLQAQYPTRNKGVSIGTRSLKTNLVGADVSNWMWMLFAAGASVLVTACANAAGLCLARGASRERELRIRAALGASRHRIVRQLVMESLVLSVSSAAIAAVAARFIVTVMKGSMPSLVPRVADMAVDPRVLAIVAVVSIATALVFGGLPALSASRVNLAATLMAGRGSIGGGRHLLRRGLIAVEVALVVVLLCAAALFAGSFAEALRVDPGVRTDHVLVVQLAPRVAPGQPRPDLKAEYAEIVTRVAASPNVRSAAVVLGGVPFGGMNARSALVTDLTPPEGVSVSFRRISPDYFNTLRIPLRTGRFFDAGDRDGREPVAIVSELAVKNYFPGGRALGASIVIDKQRCTVVGVVADAQQNQYNNRLSPEVYVPVAFGAPANADLLVHTGGDPSDAVPAVRAAVRAALPGVPLRDIRTLDAMAYRQYAEFRVDTVLVSLFGIAGLAISAIGLYGLLTHVVTERTREIGVRMALGASRGSTIRLIVRQAGVLLAAGLAAGAVASRLLVKTMEAFVFQVSPGDLRALAAAVVSLLAVAVVAVLIPARRAASVDPLVALKTDE